MRAARWASVRNRGHGCDECTRQLRPFAEWRVRRQYAIGATEPAVSSADDRHRALALAAQLGHADVVRLLLEAGEDPDRYNPKAAHAHATPLHHAALHGHADVVRLLVERGARLDMRDTSYHATPLGWAEHSRHEDIAAYLRTRGAAR